MKNLYLLIILVFSTLSTQAQTIDELKSMKAEKAAAAAKIQAEADALKAEAASLQSKIEIMSGWRKSLSGLAGFNLANSNNWIANPNPKATSTALNFGLTGLANLSKEKSFWNNKLLLSKGWQDIDIKGKDTGKDDLFDNGIVDLVNLSSLGGYKVTPKLAISSLGEMNTSMGNFFAPGTIDIGAGITWLPIQNLTVVIHPLNYNYKFSGFDNVASTGGLGAKLRADYGRSINVAGRKLAWSTTLTSFLPYNGKKTLITADPASPNAGAPYDATLFEYTWLNSVSFELWKGIGVGVNFGFRDAGFEFRDLQSFSSVGLTWGF